MLVPIDLDRVSCSGRLHRWTPRGASCLEIAISDGIRLCAPIFFIWPFGFRGSVVKFCWLLLSCGTISRLMVKSVSKECHGSRDMRTGNGGSSLCVVAELASWFMTRSSGIESRGNNIGEFQLPTLRDKNPRSNFSWLCLAIALFKTLFFCKWGLSSGWKPKIYDRVTMTFVYYFLLEGVAFVEAGLWC
jgi:hypothetical protein